jgi:hypothetical protein
MDAAATYEQHVQDASQYAAIALAGPPASTADLTVIEPLRDDVLDSLTSALAATARLSPRALHAADDPHAARHTVQQLLDRLAGVPRLHSWEDSASPVQRLQGRPHYPVDVTHPTQAWMGLAADSVLLAHALDDVAGELYDAQRWTVVHDLSLLAEAVAVLDGDLAHRWPLDRDGWRRLVTVDAHLAACARETRTLAVPADDPATLPTKHRRGPVVVITDLTRLPAATARLAHLLADPDQRLTVPTWFGTLAVLAQASLAAAQALAAVQADGYDGSLDVLDRARVALRAHGLLLTRFAQQHQRRLGSMTTGTPAVEHQAREIGASAVPHLRRLGQHPDQAAGIAADLVVYGTEAGRATQGLRSELLRLHESGALLVRDPRGIHDRVSWINPAAIGALPPLLDQLDVAAAAAYGTPQISAVQHVLRTPPPRPVALTWRLQAELDRRRARSRPADPHSPGLVLFPPYQR